LNRGCVYIDAIAIGAHILVDDLPPTTCHRRRSATTQPQIERINHYIPRWPNYTVCIWIDARYCAGSTNFRFLSVTLLSKNVIGQISTDHTNAEISQALGGGIKPTADKNYILPRLQT